MLGNRAIVLKEAFLCRLVATINAPVAPARFAEAVRRMASAVLFDPVPAMTLIRPAA